MSLNQNLRLAQVQKLVMTQQMQQAVKLLQLNHQELVAEVQQQLVENPTLEEVPGSITRDFNEAEYRLQDASRAQAQDVVDQNNGTGAGGENIDWNKYTERFQTPPGDRVAGSSGMDELPPIETNLTRSAELADHLLGQLRTLLTAEDERRAAVAIIQNLDERGYLDAPVDYIAEEAEVDEQVVEDAIEIVQGLDPIGCGSRGLAECLVAQARRRWPGDDAVVTILARHLSELESRNYTAIARSIGQEAEDVHEYHRMIRELNPRPGLGWGESPDYSITPDVAVERIAGIWQIKQNDDGLPRLRLSPHYAKVLLDQRSSAEDKRYIKERMDSAEFLIRSIYKRQRTIHKVMEAILKRQQDFFERGPEHLHPMVLRDVADEIGVHESTVSRVTTNKYVQTAHGIFELKFFFSAAIQRSDGGNLAGESVRRKLEKMVADEDPLNPLSDNALVEALEKQGIEIARRTVAKYREQLGILPASKRKRLV